MNELEAFFDNNKKAIAICLLVISFLLVVYGFSGSIMKVAGYIAGWFIGKWCFNTIWSDDNNDDDDVNEEPVY